MMKGTSTTLGLALLLCGALQAQQQLSNQDIWYSPTFNTEMVGGLASMNDGLHYTVLEVDADEPVVNQYAYRTGAKVATLVRAGQLVPSGTTVPLAMDGYSFSADEQRMLIETESEAIYRYSYEAQHWVFDRRSKALQPLSDPKGSKQRLATFSPTGTHACFVRDNDMYVVDLATMEEQRITHDGQWNEVLNGATDWVYEEEFKLVQGYAWSPRGSKLLYLRSDEKEVKEFSMAMYQGQLYPSEYRFKYPKAGEVNSTVSLHVYDLRNGTTTDIPLGDLEGEVYIPRLGWTADDEVLWFMAMDRLQQRKQLYTLRLALPRPVQQGLAPKLVYDERSSTYIEVTDNMHFLANGSGLVLTSEESGWNHIWYVDMERGTKRQLTDGAWDVGEVKGVDDKGRRVLFTASVDGPLRQGVWSVGLDGKGLKRLSPEGGTNDAEFSNGFRFFINTRSTAGSPPVVTLHDGSGKLVKTLKDNQRLVRNLARFNLQPKEFMTIPAADGSALDAWMIKPPVFQSRERHPVLITQYSGPDSKQVTDAWGGRNDMWYQMLAQKGYIVLCVDPRGTGRHGRDFRHSTYGQLGRHETDDLMAAARWLGEQPWVDKERIGCWGWSYGGYMSSLCITKGADLFKAAIAVAPVTNWRFYDTIYTERYMGLPQANGKGYDDNSPINHVQKLKGNYLIVHGMADDNVHYQNAAEMINALVRANKRFDQLSYPDRNHGIYGGTTRLHLFEYMTDWLERNL